jgi:hypothetical protein
MEDLTSEREDNAMTMEATRNQQKIQYKGEKCIFIHNECFPLQCIFLNLFVNDDALG